MSVAPVLSGQPVFSAHRQCAALTLLLGLVSSHAEWGKLIQTTTALMQDTFTEGRLLCGNKEPLSHTGPEVPLSLALGMDSTNPSAL